MLRQVLYPSVTAAVTQDATTKLFEHQQFSSLEKIDSGMDVYLHVYTVYIYIYI